ncbi:MAG: ANTAR domain-containing protein [Treponema sp.]|jgi:response regulator NasT|nr:ANTAR domain-containing protein [Treponema sp.]
MNSALIVSDLEKDTAFFSVMLNVACINQITCMNSVESAGKILSKQDFDLIIVNSPLKDESGENFSRYAASRGVSQVILLVESECFDAVAADCEDYEILILSKPVDKALFWSAVLLAKSTHRRIRRVEAENARLKQKIDDIRVINRAKCLLISYMKMSEQESHRYIEKQAMDMRSTKRNIAEGILKRYDNYQPAEERVNDYAVG